jgi:hypothetical protein
LDHFLRELVEFLLGTVNPMNAGRLGEFRHLFHPAQQVFVLGERNGWIGLSNGRHKSAPG